MLRTIRKAMFGRKKTLSRSSFIPAAGFSYGNSRLWGQWTKTVASIFIPTRKKMIFVVTALSCCCSAFNSYFFSLLCSNDSRSFAISVQIFEIHFR